MPIICMFNGIEIQMYFYEDERHHLPHIHARYGEHNACFSIQDGTVLAGMIPPRQTRLVQTWIELRRDELIKDWNLAINGETLFSIDPLK